VALLCDQGQMMIWICPQFEFAGGQDIAHRTDGPAVFCFFILILLLTFYNGKKNCLICHLFPGISSGAQKPSSLQFNPTVGNTSMQPSQLFVYDASQLIGTNQLLGGNQTPTQNVNSSQVIGSHLVQQQRYAYSGLQIFLRWN
jgi:hypothetical protein